MSAGNKTNLLKPKNVYASMGRFKLPTLQHPPALADLQSMLSEEKQQFGPVIELPWRYRDEDYSLIRTSPRVGSQQSPTWALQKGKGDRVEHIWAYETFDVSLVHSMTLSAFPEEALPAPEAGSFYALSKSAEQLDHGGTVDDQAGRKAGSPETKNQNSPGLEQRRKGVFEGDLSHLPIFNLIQSLASSRVNGRLALERNGLLANLFFEDGKPCHCEWHEVEGEDALLELLSWQDGYFRFYSDEPVELKTIKTKLESLLMEGAALIDYRAFLERSQISPTSILIKKQVDAAEYKELLQGAVPVDQELQLQFFQSVTGNLTLAELIRNAHLRRRLYIPIIYNLAKCGLISLSARPVAPNPPVRTLSFDAETLASLSSLKDLLINKETQIYSYPAFIYFLDQETKRFKRYKRPYSIILARVLICDAQGRSQPLPQSLSNQLLAVIQKNTRSVDYLCHYEKSDFAIILPETLALGCELVRKKIQNILRSIRLSDFYTEYAQHRLDAQVGSASIPEDGEDAHSALMTALATRDNQ